MENAFYFKRGVPKLTTDANGNTVLVGAGSTEYPLLTRKVTTLLLNSDSASAYATGVAVEFTSIERDDTGLCNLTTNPTKIFIPDAVKFFRVSFAIAYKYVDSTPEGTYRGAAAGLTINGSTIITFKGLSNPIRSAPLLSLTSTEAVVSATLRTVDTADISGWGTGATADDNFIELKTSHDSSTTPTTLWGSATAGTYLQVEMWE